VTLIETGAPTSAPIILEGLQELGVSREEVRRILVTHVHLDHAGGVGPLVKEMPWVQVYIHEQGVPHLIDPSALTESTRRAMGDLFALFGNTLPVPEGNVVPVTNQTLEIGNGKLLRIFEAPGHAPHQVCYYEENSRYLFCGEALGNYYEEEGSLLIPAVAPPAFDLVAYLDTIHRIDQMDAALLLFSQFGPCRQVKHVIIQAVEQLRFWEGMIRERLAEGKKPEQIIAEFKEEDPQQLGESFTPAFVDFAIAATVWGYALYFKSLGHC
jgi:glyoxylase-like metal-dependent hydrolase (beta-lactamase superfamily II)